MFGDIEAVGSCIRLSFGRTSVEEIEDGIQRLARVALQ
jgi:DNA-binding transcriptional MocR family regulator